MRKARVKKLRKKLNAMLGDKPITPWMWRKHKEAYVRSRVGLPWLKVFVMVKRFLDAKIAMLPGL